MRAITCALARPPRSGSFACLPPMGRCGWWRRICRPRISLWRCLASSTISAGGLNWAANTRLLPAFHAIAQEVGCSPAQLALAWLLHQGANIIPIPGTTSVAHLLDNLGAVNVRLDAQTLAKLDALINQTTVAGSRYNAQGNLDADTEQF